MKKIILSYDTFFALIALMLSFCLFPDNISNSFCAKIYGVGINVLSIVFSIFFASLAVIISHPDNSFIEFIEQPPYNIFSRLIGLFKITLYALFISLIATIILYIYAEYNSANTYLSKPFLCLFIFIFVYSLMATALAVNTTLQLTKRRTKYINIKNRIDENKSDELS